MKVIQCENHHYYDSGKYGECPYCAAEISGPADGDFRQEEKTVAFSEEEPDEEKTIGLFHHPGKTGLVTGWLVCVKGDEKGADYRLSYGRNFIGRSLDMDVSLAGDVLVTRKNHGSVVYDERNNIFYAVPGNGAMKLNGRILEKPEQLMEDMLLEIGCSIYRFIPYCGSRRSWK